MADNANQQEHTGAQQSGQREETGHSGEGYTPASFEKRAAAWMGIVYMLMLLFILNFTLFTGGRELPGTFPLFLVPVCVTLAVVIVRRLKTGALPGGRAGGVLALTACAAGTVLALALGVPALIAAFGG